MAALFDFQLIHLTGILFYVYLLCGFRGTLMAV